jgi:hypothetical protein
MPHTYSSIRRKERLIEEIKKEKPDKKGDGKERKGGDYE